MIEEIQVINPGGIPLFYHSEAETDAEQGGTYLLQASFITALTQFAAELQHGEIKLISMERKNYLMAKANDFIVIFTSTDEGPDTIVNYQPTITQAADYLITKFAEFNLTGDELIVDKFDQPMQDFNEFLKEKDLVKKDTFEAPVFRRNVSGFVFKSVGYEPGKCNIGQAERNRRLSFGFAWLFTSFVIYAAILLFELDPLLIFVTLIPNFLGFLGLYQYFYRFCTTNALNETYTMV